MEKNNKQKGITLVVLVITIIILIILTGVAINLTLGENGILRKANDAKEQQLEQSAREKLELVLMNANIEKIDNVNYNSNEFLTDMIEKEGMLVTSGTADTKVTITVDGYMFLVDKEKLVILENLGESEIKIVAEVQEYLGKNENNKYTAIILIIAESNIGLKNIKIENPDGTNLEISTDKNIIGKDMKVEFDEEYIVTATTKDEKTQTIKVIEKSKETISSVRELVLFRDEVNKGLTYEGKTIELMSDIDLEGNQQNQWIPISKFWGNFDGNHHSIKGVYIDSNEVCSGLFSENYGTIQNLKVSGTINNTNEKGIVRYFSCI